jgi:8-oxo-dGTP pyrophosphatase MutT (NUDIX family)
VDYINNLRKFVGNQPLILVGAAVLILDQDGHLLLLRRSDNEMWGIPGGAMEPGESLEETARREASEETGLSIGMLELFDVFSGPQLYYQYPNGDEVYNVSAVYIGREISGEVKTNREHHEFAYFEPQKLPEQISPPVRPVLDKFRQALENDERLNKS